MSSSSKIIDGKARASALLDEIKRETAAHIAAGGRQPGLAVVLVGNDPASAIYVRNKARETKNCGMLSVEHRLDARASQAELLGLITRLNTDPAIHGILVQLPLPAGIDAEIVLDAIDPSKDVDGFHIVNVGKLAVGLEGLVPCTPRGCVMLLRETLGDLAGLHAVVAGRSNIVGKPIAQLLLRENCTVTIAHSRSRDLPALSRQADILVAAVGRAEMIKGSWIKPGACVIDVGINRIEREGKNRLVGDVAFDEAVQVAGYITPVPGGVGPMTIACLLRNTLDAAKRQ